MDERDPAVDLQTAKLAEQVNSDLMVRRGYERYQKRQEKEGSLAVEVHTSDVIEEALFAVSKAIEVSIEAVATQGRGRPPSWYSDLKDLDPDLLAYLALNSMMSAVSRKYTLTATLGKIGKQIELEIWAKGLKTYDPGLSRYIQAKVTKNHNGGSSGRYRVKAARIIANKAGYAEDAWDDERKSKAASCVYNCVMQTTDIFELWLKKRRSGTSVRMIGLTADVSERLAQRALSAAWQEPMLMPMVTPPEPWSSTTSGGYRDPILSVLTPLVRAGRRATYNAIEHQIKTNGLPLYMKALNAIQATPLVLCDYTLEAVKFCWFMDKDLPKFPRRSHLSPPKLPENFDELDAFAKKGHRIHCRDIAEKNREIDAGIATMSQDFKTADYLVDKDEFYLVWNFDFRGRVYPTSHFSYHREEHIKALFMFKERKPVDDTAAMWMRIDIANLGDFERVSKKALVDREQWSIDNEELIYRVGTDYKSTFDTWSKADKPFQFLTACHEYAKWLDDPSYEPQKPIAFDGSNSCVQHYSAASLDRTDGELVNLTPADLPNDVYSKVAHGITQKLQDCINAPPATGDELAAWETTEALRVERSNKKRSAGTREVPMVEARLYTEFMAERKERAQRWLDWGISRSLVKRNTMTFGYSSAQYGFAEQLMDDCMIPLERDVARGRRKAHPFGDKASQEAHSTFLAAINYPVISATIPSAKAGMDFICALAGRLAHEKKHMAWRTPMDFPVMQNYVPFTTKKVKLYLYDRVLNAPVRSTIMLHELGEGRVDKKKSKDSAAPNVIHSWDSNHLLATVLAAEELGIKSHMCIHDSFATIPADANLLSYVIRSEFHNQYAGYCMYQNLLDQITQQLNNPNDPLLPPVPEKGDLVLLDLMLSDYCFS